MNISVHHHRVRLPDPERSGGGARRYNMDRTVTAVIVATIMAMSCCVLLVSDEGDADTVNVAKIGDQEYPTLQAAYSAANSNDTIVLISDVELTERFDISKSVTLNLNGHTIFADADFEMKAANSGNQLVNIMNISDTDVVKVYNGILRTGVNNDHTLNIYKASNVELKDLVIDHTASYRGAPLVINGSEVTLGGSMTFITGDKSWHAVNVDNKEGGSSGVSVETNLDTELHFEGVMPYGFVFDKNGDGLISLEFGNGTTATSDKSDFILFGPNVGENMDGITVDDDAVEIILVNQPEPTPTPGYDDDEDLPPFVPTRPAEDDDTVTIVACAAAAAVAAILAVFLVIDRK